jgi:hypothetical protein
MKALMQFWLGLSLVAAIFACGDDGPTTPTGPSQARFTFSVDDRDWFPNPDPGTAYLLTAIVTIQETAGLGANIDFLRLEGQSLGGTYERSEIGSDEIVAELGTNRVEARATWSYMVGWDWNMQDARGYRVSAQLTDDRGNVSTLVSRDEGYIE